MVQMASGVETQKHVLTVYWSAILWMTVGMDQMKTAVVSALHYCLLTAHKIALPIHPWDERAQELLQPVMIPLRIVRAES